MGIDCNGVNKRGVTNRLEARERLDKFILSVVLVWQRDAGSGLVIDECLSKGVVGLPNESKAYLSPIPFISVCQQQAFHTHLNLNID